MFTKAVFPGKYIQGQGALNELINLVELFGSNGLMLVSPTVKNKVLPKFASKELLEKIPLELFNGECSEDELSRLAEIIRTKKIDVLIAMGGGKLIDTAKIASDRANIYVIVVPTIASTDAPCSGCAVTYSTAGEFEAVHYQKSSPSAVLVDIDIIANSPSRYLVSGMGDALATWFEARSCERTQSMNECGGSSTLAGLGIAKICYETLLKFGVLAKIANESNAITPALNYIVEANILLSGIGFESSGIAAAHAIHNGLTALEETHSFYHGEKVAFGTLAQLHLIGAEPDEIAQVYIFCERVGLPTTLAELGISQLSGEKLMKVAEKSCEPGQSIHHEAGEITPDKVLNALILADAYGKFRKANLNK